jgi:hypothetical protein
MRKHASFIVALLLVVLVIGACIVRTSRPAPRRGGPVYVEKHKPQKHKKQKKPKKWKD